MRGFCKLSIDCSLAEDGSLAWLFGVIQADDGLLEFLVGRSADASWRRVARSLSSVDLADASGTGDDGG